VQLQGPDAAINKLDANGCTPLMYAVMADSKLAIEMLLNFGAKREQVGVCVEGGGGGGVCVHGERAGERRVGRECRARGGRCIEKKHRTE